MTWLERLRRQPWLIRLTHWEYWPTLAFYWPMFLAGPWLALRSRHPVFFSAANPSIKAGGLGLESKYLTLQKIPEEWRPRTVYAPFGADFDRVLSTLKEEGISFPLIAKPDIGFRGLLVTRIETQDELRTFLERYPLDFILQEFLNFPEEMGVLYYRLPGKERGRITSVTLKQFMTVTGDGRSTVEELVRQNQRASLQLNRLRTTDSHRLATVPAAGEQVRLGIVGNHSKGTRFINGNAFIDPQLEATFDRIADRIEGFHYGRFDIKCEGLDRLRQGKEFKILEINGVCSEPTHIYDPQRITYFGALRDILRHWGLISRISASNHARGVPFMTPGAMLRELAALRRYLARIRELEKVVR